MRRFLIVVPLILLTLIFTNCSGGPTSVVQGYVQRLAAGDAAGASNYCTGDILELMRLGNEMFSAQGGDVCEFTAKGIGCSWKEMASDMSMTIIENTSHRATVLVRKDNVRVTLSLVKVSGNWRISDIWVPRMGSITNMLQTA